MRWAHTTRGDAAAVALANRHYPRRRRAPTVGAPGYSVVLVTPEGDAVPPAAPALELAPALEV